MKENSILFIALLTLKKLPPGVPPIGDASCVILPNGTFMVADSLSDQAALLDSKTGHVFYCRTHDHSSMAVASKKCVSTHFDVPANIEHGKSKLEVVANGIPSKPKHIFVK